MRDVNINLNPIKGIPMAKQYINMLSSNGMVPCITKLTRVTDQPKTIKLIDHFITNNTRLQIKPNVFQIDMTDHNGINHNEQITVALCFVL